MEREGRNAEDREAQTDPEDGAENVRAARFFSLKEKKSVSLKRENLGVTLMAEAIFASSGRRLKWINSQARTR